MIAPFLIHVDFSKPFVLETYTSNFVVGVMFSQLREDNFFHPIGFCFHNFFLSKINYEIHDKKLLTIVDAFEKWRHLLEKVQHEINVYLDHKNLQYFMITRVLNQCQAKWALSLFQFQFVITYCFRC
jgi:hypothetical protein